MVCRKCSSLNKISFPKNRKIKHVNTNKISIQSFLKKLNQQCLHDQLSFMKFINPNKTGLISGQFEPLSCFKKNLSNIKKTLCNR